ncbi:4-aminobutyrate aminotransferase-like enzyme [Planotetraspora sp. GP83]
MSQPEQRRVLRTALPGPRSVKLQEQRTAELATGLGVTLPVFIDHAGGAILVDVDGNHLIDLASGIAVTSVGASHPMFACEHEGVVPDLVTTAKALAGGMPLSAVTGRAEIMDAVAPGGLGGTYAGNPVARAAALAVLPPLVIGDELLGDALTVIERAVEDAR